MSPSHTDAATTWVLRGFAVTTTAIVALIVLFLITESLPALNSVGPTRFFSDPSWHPDTDTANGAFNLLPMLAGTVLASAGALLLAAPVGMLSAVYCNYYAPATVARHYRHLLALIAGIPSVVYGLWGLIVLVPLIRRIHPPGPSLLAGTLVLALMVVPTIALTADAALRAVPRAQLASCAALAMSRATTIRSIAFPAARAGIFTGIILAAGRAIGETMAILMVCGNIVQTPTSIFDPIRTLTANIALEMAYAMGHHRSALFVCGLALMGLVVALVAAAHHTQRCYAHA